MSEISSSFSFYGFFIKRKTIN